MTKKDYELIAGVIRSHNYGGVWEYIRDIDIVAESFATTLALHNPKFDRNKFLQACGIETRSPERLAADEILRNMKVPRF